MMENVRKISKKYYLRQIVACWLVCWMGLGLPLQVAMAIENPLAGALPSGESVAAGSVGNFNRDTTDQLHLEEVADGTIINWTNFDIGSEAWTEFQQIGGAASAVLNRVSDGEVTGIMGQLTANGRVFVVNPAGIIFGSSSSVNVAQLVASSLDIADPDFLDGLPYTFTGGATAGDIVNEGVTTINAEQIALIGQQVINKGALVADDYVVMAAGETVVLQADPGASNVAVVVTMPDQTPGEYSYIVDQGGENGTGEGSIEADHVILAAGDIWSTAIEGVETLRAEAKGNVDFTGDVHAYAEADSDAVADVTIITGGDLVVDYDITAEAVGDGVDDAIAGVTINAAGNVDIKSLDSGSAEARATTVEAIAHDGVENHADVKITAEGDVRLLAPDRVTVKAEAYEGETLNEATVKVDADNVEVKSLDTGISNEPAEIVALASDADENRAKVDIEADGYVEIIGDGGDDVAQVIAEAKNGSDNYADVIIDAVGYVDVLAKQGTIQTDGDGGASVLATAYNEEESAVLNKANISVNASNVTVKDDASNERDGQVDDAAEIRAKAYNGEENTADVTVTASGDEGSGNVNVIAENGGSADIDAIAEDGENNTAGAVVNTDGDVNITADGDDSDADIEAEADDADNSNTAKVTVKAGGDVIVTAKDTRDDGAQIKAKAEDGYSNTADVEINADGGVRVQADAYFETWADAKIMAEAQNDDENNTATVIVDAIGDVEVIANHGSAEIFAEAEEGKDNDATVKVITDGDVKVIADSTTGITSGASIEAEAEDGLINTAETVIDAAGDVLVMATAGENAEAKIEAEASKEDPSQESTADVKINAGGNVEVTTEDGGTAKIEAEADVDIDGDPEGSSGNATSFVNIDAVDVIVGQGGIILADADIDNYDDSQINTYTGDADADVVITASGVVTVDGLVKAEADIWNKDGYEGGEEQEGFPGDIYSGSSFANVTIDNILGLGVTVGPGGTIIADSEIINWDYPDSRYENNVYSGNAFAGIDIQTCGDVIVDGLIESLANIDLWDVNPENDEYSNDTFADVIIKAFGDVIVNSEAEEEPEIVIEPVNGNGGPNGQIEAVASNGAENSAAITVLAASDVIVNNGSDTGHPRPFLNSQEEIRAAAYGDSGSTNNAFVGIATHGFVDPDGFVELDGFVEPLPPGVLLIDGDIIVDGQIGARTWIEGEGGSSNTSEVEICAARDVIVNGGSAVFEVLEQDTLLVESEEGGQITAGAKNGSINTANVEIYAGRDVTVHGAEIEYVEFVGEPSTELEAQVSRGGFYDGGQILALTWGSRGRDKNGDLDENTSSIGIYAQDDVTIHGPAITGEPPVDSFEVLENGDDYGEILAGAHGEDSINDADIEICAQDDVTIDGEVIAEAGTTPDPDNEHYADIVIAAGGGINGTGWIYAEADPIASVAEASITLVTPDAGNIGILITGEHFGVMDHVNPEGDGLPDIIEDDVDCPLCDFEWIDWEWCEDCEESRFFNATPIVPFELPMIEGCPVEMGAAALELGITGETIQVAIADALALNPSIQPCQACATLIDAAAVLRDEDGSRMAAMNAVFNELAPAGSPFTPEMSALIVTAFADAAEGSQYASVAEYVDAYVQYVAVLDTDLGSPVDDSLAFVMDKYGTGLTASENSNIAAFVATRLESGATFGD